MIRHLLSYAMWLVVGLDRLLKPWRARQEAKRISRDIQQRVDALWAVAHRLEELERRERRLETGEWDPTQMSSHFPMSGYLTSDFLFESDRVRKPAPGTEGE